MSDLTFIKNLPSEFNEYHLLPTNTRYPCDWGYNRQKEVYHILQLIGNGKYIFLVTDSEFSYWGHSSSFSTSNKLGQDYKEQTVQNTIKGEVPALFSNWYVITSTWYTSDFGRQYKIYAIQDNTSSVESKKFLDVICQEDGTFTALGSSSYNDTLQIVNRLK